MSCSKDLKILLNYRRLKEIKRCNNFPVLQKEDVAEHSFYVALYTMYIAKEFNENVGKHNMEYHPYDAEHIVEGFDVEEAVFKALTHDLEESFTSDIPWNIKHHTEETHELISKAITDKLDGLLEGSNRHNKEIAEYNRNSKSGREGKLVDIIDMLELAIYSSEEVCHGNRSMKPMLDKCLKLMTNYELYEDLIRFSPTFNELIHVLNGSVEELDEMYNSMIEIS